MSFKLNKEEEKKNFEKHKQFLFSVYKSDSRSIPDILSDASKSELATLCIALYCVVIAEIPLEKKHFKLMPQSDVDYFRKHFKEIKYATLKNKAECLKLILPLKIYLPPLLYHIFL